MSLRNILIYSILCYLMTNSILLGYQDQGYQYLYPQPDAKYAPCETTLILRFQNISPAQVENLNGFISIAAEKSGIHTGRTKIASDQKTVIFTPDTPFQPGETATVTLAPAIDPQIGSAVESITYRFTVVQSFPAGFSSASEADEPEFPTVSEPLGSRPKSQAAIMPNGVSVPSDFPHIAITVNDNPCADYIFMDNRGGGPGRPYTVIFDNTGSPVWYMQTPDERRDCKVQRNGWITMIIRWGYEEFGGSGQGFLALDSHYNPVKTFYATNGYYTDEHELQVLSDGGYLIIGRRNMTVDMSQYVPGGQTDATVLETCIQEYTSNDELIFQWAAWDHYDIRDIQLSDPTNNSMYLSHMNSIDIDDDGHLIISNRELSEITKINRQTGDFIWRLGGAHNQFTFVNDPLQGTRNQHYARVLGGGLYSAFDNGNGHNPPVSRAVKYRLNTTLMTATLVWEYRESGWFSQHMSNAQQLPNGNMLINWGQSYLPKLTEIRPDGSKAFQMDFVYASECYRVQRCAWDGMCEVPVLDYEAQNDNITLLFNKFGDPDVDYYRIYSGPNPNPTTPLDTSRVSMKQIRDLGNGYYWFRVTSVNHAGQESGYSNQEQVYVNFTNPGENLVENGDFSEGGDEWIFELQNTGQGTLSIEDGEAHIAISNGGTNVYDVQFRQNGIPLIQGNTYLFEFDARADASRTIEAKVGQDVSPFTNYSQIGPTFITPVPQRYSYEFEMTSTSDFNSRVVFNIGQSNADVTIDNVWIGQKVDQWSYTGNPQSLPGIIQCEEYDFGGEGIAFHDDAQKDGNAEFRPGDNVDVEISGDVDDGYNVGWTVAGEWLEYSVDVEPGIYNIEYRTASEPGGGELEVILDDVSLTTFQVPATGGWQAYETLTQSGIEIEGGENLILRLNIIAGSHNMNWLHFINTTSAVSEEISSPQGFALRQNYPNPFNPETRIEYQIPDESDVVIRIYNVVGEEVRTLVDEKQSGGRHSILWDGTNHAGMQQASGLYIVSLQAGLFKDMKKITLLR